MPTSLPIRRAKPRATLFLGWVVALCVASIAIEWLDPAPMDVAAAWVVSP